MDAAHSAPQGGHFHTGVLPQEGRLTASFKLVTRLHLQRTKPGEPEEEEGTGLCTGLPRSVSWEPGQHTFKKLLGSYTYPYLI